MPYTPTAPTESRAPLAPGLLAGIVCVAGVALIGGEWFLAVRYVVAILAAILAVFAGQAGRWWWLVGLVPVIVLLNPVWPIDLPRLATTFVLLGSAIVVVAVGVTVRVPLHRD